MKRLKQILCTIVSLSMIFMIIPDIDLNVHAEPVVTVLDTANPYEYTATVTCNDTDEVKLYPDQIFKLTETNADFGWTISYGFMQPEYASGGLCNDSTTAIYEGITKITYGDYEGYVLYNVSDYMTFKSSSSGTFTIYAECRMENGSTGNMDKYSQCTITITVNSSTPQAPQISSITPPSNGTYKTGNTLDFTVTFNEAVTVTGTPRLPLTIGSPKVYAEYVSTESTSTALKFRYTVANGDTDTDGIAICSPIELNSGTIRNASNVDATLSFLPPSTSGVLVDTSYTVTFDKNGGTTEASPATAKTNSSGNVTLPTTPPTKTGYTFDGWNTQADGNGTPFDNTTPVTDNITVYAKWEADSAPEIDIQGKGISIANIDITPNTADDTDFGSVNYFEASGKVSHTFTIKNTGNADLALSGTPIVSVGGANASDFTVSQPVISAVAAGNSTTFTVEFNPSAKDERTAVISITNNDLNENPYVFAIKGTGTTYTVKFYADGTKIAEAEAGSNGKVTLPTTPTKDGWEFDGWNTSEGDELTADTVVSSNITVYARWNLKSYTVTFETDGGSTAPTPQSVYHDNTVIQPADPSKTDCRFDGWYNGASKWNFITSKVTDNITLTAHWISTPYTVTYNGNGNTGGTAPADSQKYADGDSVTVKGNTGNLTKTGCTFGGWATSASAATADYQAGGTFPMGTANVTLYAVWEVIPTYTVSFDSNGGSPVADITDVPSNTTINLLATPTFPGYRFMGWYTSATGGTEFTSTTAVTENIILYAHWSKLYSVTYNGNGSDSGSVPTDANTYISGETVTVLGNTGNLTKAGCTFGGWATSPTGSAISSHNMMSANVILYAVWITAPEIDIQGNGNSIASGNTTPSTTDYTDLESVNIVSGSAVTRTFTIRNTGTATLDITNITVSDTTNFSIIHPASNTISAGSSETFTVKFDPSSTGEKTATIIIESDDLDEATYTFAIKGTGTTYTVTFSSNGIDTYSTAAANSSGTVTLPATNPTKTGYTFDSWNTTTNGTGEEFTSSSLVTANTTVFAKWNINQYNVTFDTDGGSTNPDTQTINYNDYVTKPADPTKIDCRFDGWYNDSTKWIFTTDKVTDNIPLTAHWISTPYTVAYDSNGATSGTTPTDSKKYAQNDSVTLAGNTGGLTKTGYTFGGWATSPTGSAISSHTMMSENVVFYAVWKAAPKTYTVTYNGNGNDGGTVPTDINTYTSGSAVTLTGNTGNLTKTGYTFGGWATSPTGSAISTHTMGSENATFYAVWSPSSSSGNSSSSSSLNSATTPVNTTKEEPFLEENGGTGKTITDKLEAAKDDKPVEIDMNGSSTVKSEWLETIAGKDVDMVLDMGNGITMTINGTSITGTDYSNIDLSVVTNSDNIPVSAIKNITTEENVMQISFEHDGELGFTMTMTINLDKKNKGLYANLFYYNEKTKALEFMGSSLIGNDGATDMDFTHFSNYAIIIDKVSLASEDVAAGAGAESDEALAGSVTENSSRNSVAVIVLVSVMALLLVVKLRNSRDLK